MMNAVDNLKYGASGLCESDEKFRVLFEMSPMPIFLETLQGRIVDCNSAAVKMTGYSVKELLKMTAADLVPKKVSKIFPKLVEEEIKRGSFHVRAENRKKNGDIFPVEVNGRVVTIEGRKYVFVTVVDITEQQSEYNKLKQSEEGFRLLFNGISDGVLVADAETKKFFLSNPAMEKMLGMTGAEVSKLSIADIHPEAEVGRVLAHFKEMRKQKKDIIENVPVKRKDGTIFYADIRSYPFEFQKKEYMVGLFRDVTEKRVVEQRQKLEAEKLLIINQIISIAGKSENLNDLLSSSLDAILKVMDFDAGGVYLLDKDGKTASVVCNINLPKKFLRQVQTVNISDKPYKKIFVGGEPIITESYETVSPERARSSGFKSLISAPLFAGDQIIGAFNIISSRKSIIPDKVKETIISVGKEIGGAIKRMQIEESIKRHEERYRTIIQHSLDTIFTFDNHGKVVFVTPNIEKFGYSIKDVVGTDFSNYVHPDDVPRLKKELKQVVRTKKVFITEFRIVARDGKVFFVEEYGTPVFDDKGKFILFTGALRDISERKKMNEEAKNYTERLKVMFEDAPDAYYLSDMRGYLIDGNKAAEVLTGFKRNELIGRTLVSMRDFIVPGQRIKILNLLSRNVRGESTGPDEFKLRRKDGKVISVEVSTHPVKIEGKSLVLGIARDITEHIQTEAELKNRMTELEKARKELSSSLEEVRREKNISESLARDLEKYELAVKSASDHIVISDTDANIVFANHAAELITGYKVEEMIGKNPGKLWGGQMSKEFFKKMWDVIKRDKKVFIGELTNKRKTGELYDAEVHIAPILNKEGKVIFFVGIERDITKAKEIDKMKTEFVTVASHQLRTPLTSLKWYAELLLGAQKDLGKKHYDYVQRIYDSSLKMVRLVNDLLNVSRIEAGKKFTIEKKTSNILTLIKRAISDQSVAVLQNNVRIEMKKFPDKLFMQVDEEKMYQVFQNLINNAVKYSETGGKVEVAFDAKNGTNIFIIKDYGMGIPLKQQSRVFEKFFRGDNVTDAGKAGTGLGLYIARAIVEGHGGKIRFESSVKSGTTFYIELPKK